MKEGEDKFSDSSPKTQARLFSYVLEDKPPLWKTFADAAFWKQFFIAIFTGSGSLGFIPSVFADPEELAAARAGGRTRKMGAGFVSVFLHVAAILAIFFFARVMSKPTINPDDVVFVSAPIFLPFDIEGDGREGGGGGGGGKNQPDPPAAGELPETTPAQMIAPDPTAPRPLMAAEDLLAQVPSIEMPIQLPRDMSLPIGDISAPPNYSASSGSGRGGGVGTGDGTGIGPGSGSGLGPGSGGGTGGGRDGGVGTSQGPGITGNCREPQLLSQSVPYYTEEARKAKVKGTVVLEATIHKDGTIDNFRVARGLGYGLDESAINAVSTKWRFRAATCNGRPVDSSATIEVNFDLL